MFVGVEADQGTSRELGELMRGLASGLGWALPPGKDAGLMPLDADTLEFVRHAAVEVTR